MVWGAMSNAIVLQKLWEMLVFVNIFLPVRGKQHMMYSLPGATKLKINATLAEIFLSPTLIIFPL